MFEAVPLDIDVNRIIQVSKPNRMHHRATTFPDARENQRALTFKKSAQFLSGETGRHNLFQIASNQTVEFFFLLPLSRPVLAVAKRSLISLPIATSSA